MITRPPNPHDWPEDAKDEDNGSYLNNCIHCDIQFIGHKDRWFCKSCNERSIQAIERMTPEEKARRLSKLEEDLHSFFDSMCIAEGQSPSQSPAPGLGDLTPNNNNNNMDNMPTQRFIGTKKVDAQPMPKGQYNIYRGWNIPENEDPHEDGYLIEYLDGGKPNDPRHNGYISWSPATVFDKAYRPCNALTFGDAVEALKAGFRVAREGWNGKDMFLFLLKAQNGIPTAVIYDPALRQVIEDKVGGETFDAYGSIRMFTADKKILTGWLASQTDILSEDWTVLD